MNQAETRRLREANTTARALLRGAVRKLRTMTEDRLIMSETPLEVGAVMSTTLYALDAALRQLEFAGSASLRAPESPADRVAGAKSRNRPTRQQGQFLAFIRQFMLLNQSVAPSHIELQRFFGLTPPSVNSMLVRLEQRGFIRRVPGKARAIEIVCNPEWIPPLDPRNRF